jgi:O-glycosyl hydrolase
MTKNVKMLVLFILMKIPVILFSQAETIQIKIDQEIQYQTIDGFGASDAWRCQFVGKNWPLEKREYIADLLFSREMNSKGNPKGIGLSIWRFNIGAGTAEQGDSSGIKNSWRRSECFQNSDGSYDWTKHAGQQWFLEAAKQRGVEKFLAFPNSPPVHLTRNANAYADKGVFGINLKPGKMDDYAAFQVDVIEHFEKKNFHFDYLSPVNEPQWGWDNHSQEGTPATNEDIYALVKYLSSELSQRNLNTKILIGEAGTIGHASIDMSLMGEKSKGRDNQALFFFSKESPFYIGDLPNVENTISAHSYHSVWPLDKQVEYRQLVHKSIQAANPSLGYWQSEYCILQENDELGGGGKRDLGMATALYIARIIHNDLTITNAKTWQWWTAITQCDYKDGLVYLDDGSEGETGRMWGNVKSLKYDGKIRESKLLWTLGNYSRFISPGMVRINCDSSPEQSVKDGVLTSAYAGEKNNLVVVLVNLSTEEKVCNLGFEKNVDVYTTSKDMSLEKGRQNASFLKIPSRAVLTVLVGN